MSTAAPTTDAREAESVALLALAGELEGIVGATVPTPITHGVTCEKSPHVGDGYLHAPADDGPYDVDGVRYCGRCHMVLPPETGAGG